MSSTSAVAVAVAVAVIIQPASVRAVEGVGAGPARPGCIMGAAAAGMALAGAARETLEGDWARAGCVVRPMPSQKHKLSAIHRIACMQAGLSWEMLTKISGQ